MTGAMAFAVSVDVAWRIAALGMAATLALTSAELLSAGGLFEDQSLLATRLVLLRARWMQDPRIRPLLAIIFRSGFLRLVLILRIAICASLVWRPTSVLLLGLLVGANIIVNVRAPIGREGADQLANIAAFALAVGGAVGTHEAARWTVAFLAMQLILAYVVAGIAKAVARKWWTGQYLRSIVATLSYGHPGVSRIMQRWPALGTAASVSVILFEVGFWLFLFAGKPAALGFLAVGVLFHVTNAFVMGLNNFVPAFVSLYPCAWFLREEISSLLAAPR